MLIEGKVTWDIPFLLSGCIWLMAVITTFATGNSTSHITKPLRVIAVLEPPFVMKDTQTGELSGFMLDVLVEIGVPVSKIETTDDARFGMDENPEIWERVTGNLAEGSADIAIAAFGIRAENSKVVTFSQPVVHGGYMVLYKVPNEWSPREKAVALTMVQPFSPGLWCLIVLMCLLASAALYLIRRFSPYEDVTSMRRTDNPPALSWASGLLFMFSSLVGKSHQVLPTSISGRVLTAVWWIFALMTGGAYIASLVVIMFREDPHIHMLPFGSVDEMVRQTEVGILGVKNSDTYNYISEHTGFQERKIYNMWKANWDKLMVDSMDIALEMMMKSDGKYGVFMEEMAAIYLANQEPCNKIVVGASIGDQAFGFACKKGTTFCDDITHGILHLQETGQIEKLTQKWFWSGCQRDYEHSDEGIPYIDTFGGHTSLLSPLTLTITRFSAAFIILAIGIGIAFLVLVVEVVYGRKKGKVPLLNRGSHCDDFQRIKDVECIPNRDM